MEVHNSRAHIFGPAVMNLCDFHGPLFCLSLAFKAEITHVKHVFDKLNVDSLEKGVRRARELPLLID